MGDRDYALCSDDSDAPFSFDDYVAIASSIRHFGPCTVQTAALPYGMWWQQLRPQIDVQLCEPSSVAAPLARLDGVWVSDREFIGRSHPDYPPHAGAYRRAPWLDEQKV